MSDFISSDWKRDVVEPDALSLSPDGTAANPLSPGPLVASPDAAGLSVLQIPLPDALLPGLVGVAMAFVAHRRSLHGRKLS